MKKADWILQLSRAMYGHNFKRQSNTTRITGDFANKGSMQIQKLPHNTIQFQDMADDFERAGMDLMDVVLVNHHLRCFLSADGPKRLWHLSVSHPRRYPTWDELRDLRYALLPNDKTFGILFPPKEQYVNLPPNCFHLHEVPEAHEPSSNLILPAQYAK